MSHERLHDTVQCLCDTYPEVWGVGDSQQEAQQNRLGIELKVDTTGMARACAAKAAQRL